ncbi:AraC family transcriptional regulator ligand-binding domain-containing protein [Spirosoma sp. 209]|uniref:AraC family transcriptional regulator ligand-binding domain-containing protein n=1 Tax=Spirosoma sp. 209 TaxID=1955701 RepID=UPI00098D68BC|nr:AraC family transcriptional regulator ligand-binding domain-containing protein [Spirosoma sp. 209]
MATTLSSLHLANLLDYAACKGIDRSALQRLLYTPDADRTDGQGRVSRSEYCQVWEQMLQLSRDPHLGLHYGCFLNLKALGLIYQISLAASSIGQAMRLLDDYLNQTFSVVSLTSDVGPEHLVITLRSDLPEGPVRRHILDSVLFLMYRELGVLIEGPVSEVQLPHDDLSEYRRLCQSSVVRADAHRLRLTTGQVAGPINRRHLRQIETLLPIFLQLLDQSPNPQTPFAQQVRTMTLSLCAPELPTLDQVVAQFSLSHRTFQRRLTQENTSFRAIADDLKRQLSHYLEQGRSLRTQDIAYVLGYSSPSAYLHAVKKWRTQPFFDGM